MMRRLETKLCFVIPAILFAILNCGCGESGTRGGLLQWAMIACESDAYCDASGISVLEDDSLIVSGQFSGSATFGPGTGQETTLSTGEDNEAFVAGYSADGIFEWFTPLPTGDQPVLAAMPDGSFFVAGGFTGDATFVLDEANETVLSSAGGSDIYRLSTVSLETAPFTLLLSSCA
ncbi:MAG TPA: hypothetical protein VM425_08290 [Myxococcota bacterium]|nr:hypothetical protein [Myxococcota bacterium]